MYVSYHGQCILVVLELQNVAADNKMVQESFFTESEIYWAPASNPRDLYAQLSQSKFREIRRQQIQ